MKTFAQIKDGKAHWIFQGEKFPEFAPDIVIIDISSVKPAPAEGWSYDGKTFSAPPGPTADQIRARRDGLIGACDWIVQRHRDQVDAGIDQTLSDAEYKLWTIYRQDLRDLPNRSGFPGSVAWPSPPEIS